jgi:hypothetical protein
MVVGHSSRRRINKWSSDDRRVIGVGHSNKQRTVVSSASVAKQQVADGHCVVGKWPRYSGHSNNLSSCHRHSPPARKAAAVSPTAEEGDEAAAIAARRGRRGRRRRCRRCVGAVAHLVLDGRYAVFRRRPARHRVRLFGQHLVDRRVAIVRFPRPVLPAPVRPSGPVAAPVSPVQHGRHRSPRRMAHC